MAATILEFRSETEKVPAKGTRRRRRSAEILIFPGVRYERHEESPASKGNTGRRVERDILKLIE